ncbi:unnamed protein product [Paramecium octaurelia]|uniref:Protein kinase domain-containing protein n=1 Tax=Paramecium octaurelia TaxID=43137 RepID=A0A8S1V056_PAROT|nr:unnamed protein product [Paramecium octaurelia]
MQDSQNLYATASTTTCESTKLQHNCSLFGIIPSTIALENNNFQIVQFKTLLPMKTPILLRYMICLSLQLTEIVNREITIEEINLNTLKSEPVENQSYVFFLLESNQQQNLKNSFIKILKQLGIDLHVYKNANTLQDITFNLIKESQARFQELKNYQMDNYFDQFQNTLNYLKQEIEINFLQSKNTKCILYPKHSILYPKHSILFQNSQVSLITKPFYINSQEKEIVVKISQIRLDNYDNHIKVIEILESFQKDINLSYFGYFQFFSLNVTFYKYYKKTFEQFQEQLSDEKNDISLVQPIVKSAFISIIKQIKLLHDKYQVIHRDLKPQNIMIDLKKDTNDWQDYQDVDYIIIDFDCSLQIINHKQEVFETYGGGTGHYIPPERRDNEYSKQSDIYQLGVIFLETLFEIDQSQQINDFWIRRDELIKAKSKFQITENLQKSLVDMIAELPQNRPSLQVIQELLEKEF